MNEEQEAKIARQDIIVTARMTDAMYHEAMAELAQDDRTRRWHEGQAAAKWEQAEFARTRLEWLQAGGA